MSPVADVRARRSQEGSCLGKLGRAEDWQGTDRQRACFLMSQLITFTQERGKKRGMEGCARWGREKWSEGWETSFVFPPEIDARSSHPEAITLLIVHFPCLVHFAILLAE